jgi:hypothetical protein
MRTLLSVFRLCRILSNTAVLSGSLFILQTAGAEPMLKLLNQPVSGRITPEPMVIEDYHGKLQRGYETIHFVAPGGELRWDAWIDPDYIEVARQAMQMVGQKAVGNEACNRYFRENMPGGRSFDEIWQATGPQRIRISFSAGPSGAWRAATYPYKAPYEWTITENTVKFGPQSVASAMVHEATRTNGVGPEFRIAYGAATACGTREFMLTRTIMRRLGWQIGKTE